MFRKISRKAVQLSGASLLGIAAAIYGLAAAQDAPSGGTLPGAQIAATSCAECHGTNGIGTEADFPHLAGQHSDYIVQAMKAYKSGERQGEIMREAAFDMTTDEITAVATYYSELPLFSLASDRKPAVIPEEQDPFAVAISATIGCAGCHGADGNTTAPGNPELAGQSMQYIAEALRGYRDGTRGEGIMKMFSLDLSDDLIEEIAYYYAAQTPIQESKPVKGDRFAGRAAAEACVSCHGVDGNSSNPATPRLAGLDSQYLETAIKAYKTGERLHAAMQDAVANVRNAEMEDLAAYYATKTPSPPQVKKPLRLGEWVERCARCHGATGYSPDARHPILAGQSAEYLIAALEHYHLDERSNSMMYAISFQMRESDIRKLAAFYAAQRIKLPSGR